MDENQGRFYMKIHTRGKQLVVGVCDKKCLNQTYREGKLRFKVTNQFFGGDLVDAKEVLKVLKSSKNFNIVGEEICELLLRENILHEDGILRIQGVPIAIKFVF